MHKHIVDLSNRKPNEIVNGVDVPYTQEEVDARNIAESASRYGPEFRGLVKKYRDDYIEKVVSSNGISTKNTEAKRAWISTLETRWNAQGRERKQIRFKNEDGSIAIADIDDVRNLQKSMFDREQYGRDAEAFVLDKHEADPYTSEVWKNDFDDEIERLTA